MGLCGGFRCGCGVTSTPATEGAINGELPSINVSGSGEPGDPFDLQLNDAWAAEVATLVEAAEDQLAVLPPRIDYAVTAVTADGSGVITLTFPAAYTAAPWFSATLNRATTGEVVLTVTTITATTVTMYCRVNSSLLTSTAVGNLHWMAIGTLA